MDVLGKALLDELAGRAGTLRSCSSLGTSELVDPSYFFRAWDAMPELEQVALSESRGRTLDIGCGAGSHCLELQRLGVDCLGLDASAGAVEVARKRGVRQVVCSNIDGAQVGKFGTLLLLMNGIGLAGSRANLGPFLEKLAGMLDDDGQILLDSSDIRYMFEEDDDGGIWVPGDRAYYGEVSYSWEYCGERGTPFDWLFADYGLLEAVAAAAGLQAEYLAEGPHYDYLARLRPM